MRACVLETAQSMVIRDIAEPPLKPGHVMVAPRAVGLCGTDLHVYQGTMEHRVPYPAVLGHEFAGEVVEAADDVEGFAPGDPVAVDNVIDCGHCPRCAEGQRNVCENMNVFGIDSPGALAERVVVPARLLHPFPRELPIHLGALAELYSIAVHASRRTRIETGDAVVLLGAGRVGLCLLDVMRTSGARLIVSVDVDPTRLDVARQIGADATLDASACDVVEEVRALTDGRGCDKVVEAVGHPVEVEGQGSPTWLAFEMIRSAGQITLLGQGEQIDRVYWREFVLKEATVTTSRLNLGDFPRAIELLASGRLHPDRIITHRMPLAEAPVAFARLAAREPGMIKVVVEL
ncbi:MAG: zinc-dependent alcohol dehydrogenase [Planctomycetota bacterium]